LSGPSHDLEYSQVTQNFRYSLSIRKPKRRRTTMRHDNLGKKSATRALRILPFAAAVLVALIGQTGPAMLAAAAPPPAAYVALFGPPVGGGVATIGPAPAFPVGHIVLGAGVHPTAIAFDPGNSVVYVADAGHGRLDRIDSLNRTPLPGVPLPGPAPDPTALAVSPSGKFIYVADAAHDWVVTYKVGLGAAGLAGLPVQVGPPLVLPPGAVGPDGLTIVFNRLLVAEAATRAVQVLTITANTGAPAFLGGLLVHLPPPGVHAVTPGRAIGPLVALGSSAYVVGATGVVPISAPPFRAGHFVALNRPGAPAETDPDAIAAAPLRTGNPLQTRYETAYVAVADDGNVVPVLAATFPAAIVLPPICVTPAPLRCPTARTAPSSVAFSVGNAEAFVTDEGLGVVAVINTATSVVPPGWFVNVGAGSRPDAVAFVP
jgi:DNA-binding beta-propeller fold protein YncE